MIPIIATGRRALREVVAFEPLAQDANVRHRANVYHLDNMYPAAGTYRLFRGFQVMSCTAAAVAASARRCAGLALLKERLHQSRVNCVGLDAPAALVNENFRLLQH